MDSIKRCGMTHRGENPARCLYIVGVDSYSIKGPKMTSWLTSPFAGVIFVVLPKGHPMQGAFDEPHSHRAEELPVLKLGELQSQLCPVPVFPFLEKDVPLKLNQPKGC